jgi:hypothetical protein
LLVLQPVGASLEDPDLVVEPLDEAERDLVLRFAVGGDAISVAIDHVGEALVGLGPLPAEAGAPVVEEAASPALTPVVPELSEQPPSTGKPSFSSLATSRIEACRHRRPT